MPQSIRFFAHNRWIRSSTLLDSSGERTDYEVNQTKTSALAETWRSPGLPDAYVSANFQETFKIGAICLVRCNLTNNGLLRIRIGNTADFSINLYDSGWIERRRYYSDAEIAIAKTSEFFPEGLPIPDMQKRIQPQVIVVLLPSEITAQYVHIDFDDITNPKGYMEIGYIYAGKVLEPNRDLLYGWKIQRDDFVRDGQAASGQYWPSSVYNKTLMTLAMAPQTESDLLAYWILMESLVSINNEFIISLIDRNDSLAYTTTLYGSWAQAPGNTNVAFKTWGIQMAFSEIVD